jgi:hypothetical protein
LRRAQLRGLAALVALGSLLALCALLGGCARLGAVLGREPAIDIAILTVLEPEYTAAASRVEDPSPVAGAAALRGDDVFDAGGGFRARPLSVPHQAHRCAAVHVSSHGGGFTIGKLSRTEQG